MPTRSFPTPHWEALHTFNPAAIVRDGKVFVLYRAEDDSGAIQIGMHTSRLGLASSADGLHFTRLPTPVFYPAKDAQNAREWPGGVEDPRLVEASDGTYVLTYTNETRHLLHRHRHLARPDPLDTRRERDRRTYGRSLQICRALQQRLPRSRSPAPLLTAAGQALFRADDPATLIACDDRPNLKPEQPYEKTGQYIAGTTFAEGLVQFHDTWFLYYGCADSPLGVVTAFPQPYAVQAPPPPRSPASPVLR